MKILALETANEQCSVALVDEQQCLFFQCHDEPRAQTQQILPMIEQALRETKTTWQELSAIAFSRGPGSFSGVRINAAVTQALAWVHDLPVIPVSTLQALAQRAYRVAGLTDVTATLDARMHEIYFAHYLLSDTGLMQAQTDEQLLDYQQGQLLAKGTVIGSGAHLIGQIMEPTLGAATALDIADIARVKLLNHDTVPADQALPVYLRDNAWKKIGEQHKSST